MIEKIEIIQENYEKILEIAKISNSKSDLCKKLGWNGGYKREQLNVLLLNNNFDFSIFPKESYNVSPFNNEVKLKEAVKNSFNYTEVIKFFLTKIGAGHHISVKKYIKKFDISTGHFVYSGGLEPQFINNENIFIINSKVSPKTVRKRVIKENLISYKCNCGNEGCWQGQKLTLQLDHINGDRTDNRLENLRFLCPNCHALTPTYGSKNKKSIKKTVVPSISQ